MFDPVSNEEFIDLLEFESMADLIGKLLKVNFEIIEGEGLPVKLCTRTFCQYEFYQTKDKSKSKPEPSEGGASTALDEEEDTMSSDDDEFESGPKRKKKLFATSTVNEKT